MMVIALRSLILLSLPRFVRNASVRQSSLQIKLMVNFCFDVENALVFWQPLEKPFPNMAGE